jgi:dCMP deaminase
MRWVEYFRNLAHQVKLKSKDERTQIGAVIVGKDKEIVSTGYNSFPRGIKDNIRDRQERPEKYFWFEHGERNAIYNAARIGVSTKGCTMYLSCGIPCSDCARGIINAGITRIFCERGGGAKGLKWAESAERSWQMFEEAGVSVQFYDDEFYG